MSAVAEKLRTEAEQSCWTAEYLLAHCEGYRVESATGRLGYVEEVVWASDVGEPVALRVLGGRGRVTIPIADVRELHPNGEWIAVQPPSPAAPTRPRRTGASPPLPKPAARIPA